MERQRWREERTFLSRRKHERGKSFLERVVSQKTLHIASSYYCQICVMSFLFGMCITTLFVPALTSIGADFEFGWISFPPSSLGINSSSHIINWETKSKESRRLVQLEQSKTKVDNAKVSLLSSAWDALLTEPNVGESEFLDKFKFNKSSVPNAPHLENCKIKEEVSKRLDMRAINGSLMWIVGSDEENYPLTTKVQQDIWIHQHPADCRNPNIRFLIADWETIPGFGIGAQIASMCGLLAIAIKEKRVLVTNYYNRADQNGCKGSSRSSWSCYFFSETSQECRERAFELVHIFEAWEKGVITRRENYSSKEIWAGKPPRAWGDPWSYMQPTTVINGSLLAFHCKMDLRWWRAQAVRYLMRFQTEYTCNILNNARHAVFGDEAARIVLASLGEDWSKEATIKFNSDVEEFFSSSHKPWMPMPLLSMHVKVTEFEEYMHLADRIRSFLPHLQSICLSIKMQEVIDKTNMYPKWKFCYTKIRRQDTMAKG